MMPEMVNSIIIIILIIVFEHGINGHVLFEGYEHRNGPMRDNFNSSEVGLDSVAQGDFAQVNMRKPRSKSVR